MSANYAVASWSMPEPQIGQPPLMITLLSLQASTQTSSAPFQVIYRITNNEGSTGITVFVDDNYDVGLLPGNSTDFFARQSIRISQYAAASGTYQAICCSKATPEELVI